LDHHIHGVKDKQMGKLKDFCNDQQTLGKWIILPILSDSFRETDFFHPPLAKCRIL
jgi:hypothetical protein